MSVIFKYWERLYLLGCTDQEIVDLDLGIDIQLATVFREHAIPHIDNKSVIHQLAERHINNTRIGKVKRAKFLGNLTPEQLRFHRATCLRCKGTGIIPQYIHIKDGICFLCTLES